MTRPEPTHLPGTLFVVATPIGHLEDITLRALRVLKQVALVAAEDTRRTGNLLRHYEIATPLLSVHAHNERARAPRLVARLLAGESIAFATDAGTPGISDPGTELVAAARQAGIRVEPVPGASAVVTALSVSGVSSEGFVFIGFPPVRSKTRIKWLQTACQQSLERSVVFFEAPHRLLRTLADLYELVDRPIMVARELTKIHEEIVFGTPLELMATFQTPKGEFTLVIPPPVAGQSLDVIQSDETIAEEFGQITETSAAETKRDAARIVATKLGLTTKQVYEAIERKKIGRSTDE